MRFVHCADLHIGAQREGRGKPSGAACLRGIAEAACTAGVDSLLVVGDLFDRAAGVDSVQAAQEALAPLREAGILVFATEGNHDCACDKLGKAPLEALHEAGGVILLRPHREENWAMDGEPRLEPYREMAGGIYLHGGVRLLGMGYLGMSTRRRLAALLRALPAHDGGTICMLHSGVYSEERRLPLGGVRPMDMMEFAGLVDYMALGHRHGREEGVFWFNPGSPNGDRKKRPAEDQGYYIVELDRGRVERTFVSTKG